MLFKLEKFINIPHNDIVRKHITAEVYELYQLLTLMKHNSTYQYMSVALSFVNMYFDSRDTMDAN